MRGSGIIIACGFFYGGQKQHKKLLRNLRREMEKLSWWNFFKRPLYHTELKIIWLQLKMIISRVLPSLLSRKMGRTYWKVTGFEKFGDHNDIPLLP